VRRVARQQRIRDLKVDEISRVISRVEYFQWWLTPH
jgi:hypothetical protein